MLLRLLQIPDKFDGEIKHSSTSIWIAAYIEKPNFNKCLMDLTNIKSEREWYHFKINFVNLLYQEQCFLRYISCWK